MILRFILIGLTATTATASNHAETVGLRGLTSGAIGGLRRNAFEDTIGDLVENILKEERNATWNLIKEEDDGTDITLTFEVREKGEDEDEDDGYINIVSVSLNGNNRQQLISGLIDEKPHPGLNEGGPVKSVKKGKKKTGKSLRMKGAVGRDSQTTKVPATKKLTGSPTSSPVIVSAPPPADPKVDVTAVDDGAVVHTPPLDAGAAVVPTCPSHYINTATYAAGDIIENDMHIYECQSGDYEEYCSIASPERDWSDAVKNLWRDAWVLVGACEKRLAEEEGDLAEDDADAVPAEEATTTEAPATTTEATSTESASTTAAATTTEAPLAPTAEPLCPSAYDPSNTSYIAGDEITVKCDIFKCRDTDHEPYCSMAAWDDSALAQNPDANELWRNAWEMLGKCAPTQSELMEEEAEGSVAWDCIATAEREAEPPITLDVDTPSIGQDEATDALTTEPTDGPTPSPTEVPTSNPTVKPTDEPTPSPTKQLTPAPVPATTTEATTTTAVTTTEVATTTAEAEADATHTICPPAYDPTKTTYLANEQVTVKCDIFSCRDADHEIYCNMAAWDASLLNENPQAKDMWMGAWEEMGKCSPTQGEVMEMEETGGNASVEWDCLA